MYNPITISYLSIGSGHQVAAESLAEAIRQESPNQQVIAEDPFANTIDILPSVLSAFQSASLMVAPDAYDLAWRRKETYDHFQWISHTKILQDFLIERLRNHNSDVVIATHVLPCLLATGLKKRQSLVKNVYGIITDFGANSLWPIEGVDQYYVASSEVKNSLVYRGCKADAINVTGIPIHKIQKSTNVKATSRTLSILFVVGGLRGGGYTKLKNYCYNLLDEISLQNIKIKLTVVTGHQNHLKELLLTYTQKVDFEITVLGHVNNMPNLIMMNDIIITKPGGLIISEALARGICIILTQPGPGQESVNADFLARHGIAFNGEDPASVGKLLKHLSSNPKIVDKMKSAAKEFGYPNSAQNAAKSILASLD